MHLSSKSKFFIAMKRSILFLVAATIFLSLSSFNGPVILDEWERLGSRKVNYRVDRDVIRVGAYEGSFRKLKLVVTGGNLNMHKMVVEYGNGSRDEFELRYNFSRRSGSRTLDLRGGNRVIKKIIFWYDSKNVSRRRATLSVYGR
jgi:hypothetical protein